MGTGAQRMPVYSRMRRSGDGEHDCPRWGIKLADVSESFTEATMVSTGWVGDANDRGASRQ